MTEAMKAKIDKLNALHLQDAVFSRSTVSGRTANVYRVKYSYDDCKQYSGPAEDTADIKGVERLIDFLTRHRGGVFKVIHIGKVEVKETYTVTSLEEITETFCDMRQEFKIREARVSASLLRKQLVKAEAKLKELQGD